MAEDEFSAGAASTAGLATEEQVTAPTVDTVYADGTGPVILSPAGRPFRIVVTDEDGTLGTVDAGIVVSDTFTRANETPVSAAETGQAYVHPVGTGLSVISNQLGKVTGGTQASGIDTGLADGVLSYTVGTAATGASDFLSFRYTDANNQLRLRLLTGVVTQIVAGVTTTLGTLAGEQPFDADVIEVTMDGADLTFLRNGSPDLAVTTTLLTGTAFNFQFSGTVARVADYTFSTL